MTQKNEINTLGWFDGRTHYYPIHIFYEDTDYVYNSIMPIFVSVVI